MTAHVIDVRKISPPERHPFIFQTFDNLALGESFILVNDHNPKPLHYQFKIERAEAFTWEYLEDGPEEWQIRVSRVA